MIILATLCYIKRDGHTLMVYRNKKLCWRMVSAGSARVS